MISDETTWGQLGRLFIGEKAKKKRLSKALVAEAVRFELTEGVNPRRFSRPVP
jgi:hypothetical protein